MTTITENVVAWCPLSAEDAELLLKVQQERDRAWENFEAAWDKISKSYFDGSGHKPTLQQQQSPHNFDLRLSQDGKAIALVVRNLCP